MEHSVLKSEQSLWQTGMVGHPINANTLSSYVNLTIQRLIMKMCLTPEDLGMLFSHYKLMKADYK